MRFTRREMLQFSAAATAFTCLGPQLALATASEADEAIKAFTGGLIPASGKISLDAPEIAENGNTVPVSVSVDSPMTADNYVSSVMIVADGNPNPAIATFHFSAMSGEAAAKTRIRLAQTQNVIAVAKMSDGSAFMDKKEVKVTIGGCGG